MHRNIILLLLTLIVMGACGIDKQHFKLEGQLLHLSQGDFLVYSPDGAMEDIDTLKVIGGRFELLSECSGKGTALIIMPNGKEMVVFVEPGASITIKGDAANLSEVSISGTEDNEAMDGFRKATIKADEKRIKAAVADVVGKNPESAVAIYLVKKYLLNSKKPDYATAIDMLGRIRKAQPDNANVSTLIAQIRDFKNSAKGQRLPAFSARDFSGATLSSQSLYRGIVAICSWASWDYESIAQVRHIAEMNDENGNANSIKVVGLSMDPSIQHAKRSLSADSLKWTNICDGEMLESHLLHQLSLYEPAQVVLVKDGIILERELQGEALYNKINEILKGK